MIRSRRFAAASALLLLAALPAAAQFPIRRSGCEWQPGFHVSGLAQSMGDAVLPYLVYSSAVFDDGSGPALYYGGYFNTADDQVVNGLAKWDGESWSALPAGQPVGNMTVWNDGSGPALYTSTSSGIGRWDGSSWSTLPAPVAGSAGLLAGGTVAGSPRLYAKIASKIYQWNGASWSQAGGDVVGEVYTLTVWNGKLYAGGSLTQIGAVAAQRVAQWDGLAWSPLGAGLSGSAVNSLVGIGSRLYAGGSFSNPTIANVASWNGSSWSNLGAGVNGEVTNLTAYDGGSGSILAAYGDFTMAGTGAADRLAIWSGTSWTGLSLPAEAQPTSFYGVRNLVQYHDAAGSGLYIAGQFRRDGGKSANNVLRWQAGQWSPVTGKPGGLGLDGAIWVSGVQPDGAGRGLYVVGRNPVPGAGSPYEEWMMKFDGQQWTKLASAPNNVEVMKSFDDGNGSALYAGQTTFSTLGAPPSSSIRKWDGSSWTSIGSSIQIKAMEGFDDGNGLALYAAGQRLGAMGGSPNFSSYIAKWNGATWSPVGVGIYQPILALKAYGNGIYAAGDFTQIGDSSPIPADHIAKWDGTVWSPVGGGLDGRVEAMAVWNDGGGDALYAVGQFTTAAAGTVPAPGIAKWNGSTWSGVGGGASSISDIVVFDDGAGSALYVDGAFTSIGGQSIAKAARWDGISWTPVGTGAAPRGKMQVFDSGFGPALFFNGSFSKAGGLVSNNVAQYCRPGLFADGFESGLPDAWSQVFP